MNFLLETFVLVMMYFVQNLEIFHTVDSFSKHISYYRCYSQTFEELWSSMVSAGWEKKVIPAKSLNSEDSGNTKIVCYRYPAPTSANATTEEQVVLKALKGGLDGDLFPSERKARKSVDGCVPGIHLFTTPISLTQFISK
jgi:hypothetical protein